jgi:alpha-tubulin suppressor-like RCC1 family protein
MRTVLLSGLVVLLACTPAAAPPPVAPPPPSPNAAAAATSGARIAAGRGFTCAVNDGGRVRCWGKNDLSQLGNGTRTEVESKPSFVADLTDVVSVGAGQTHACALTRSGRVACWGKNETAGDEQHAVRSFPATVVEKDARALAVGGRHDCVVTTGGSALCMGWGSDGQLGNGAASSSATATAVAGLDHGVLALSAGDAHTCAITGDGKLACWGSARSGRLGNGASQTYAAALSPVDVVNMKTNVASVAAGGDRTCALSRTGAVTCWGRWKPGRPLSDAQPSEITATPLEVAGLDHGVDAIVVGQAHACALLRGGAVACWGWNERGQLGNGKLDDSETPVEVRGIGDAVALAAGDLHTCALRRGGAISCWGDGGFGQLGNGATKDSSTPVDVAP